MSHSFFFNHILLVPKQLMVSGTYNPAISVHLFSSKVLDKISSKYFLLIPANLPPQSASLKLCNPLDFSLPTTLTQSAMLIVLYFSPFPVKTFRRIEPPISLEATRSAGRGGCPHLYPESNRRLFPSCRSILHLICGLCISYFVAMSTK